MYAHDAATGAWAQEAQLDFDAAGDLFQAVALSGDTLCVGARGEASAQAGVSAAAPTFPVPGSQHEADVLVVLHQAVDRYGIPDPSRLQRSLWLSLNDLLPPRTLRSFLERHGEVFEILEQGGPPMQLQAPAGCSGSSRGRWRLRGYPACSHWRLGGCERPAARNSTSPPWIGDGPGCALRAG